jgi:hypothetical protein
MFMGHYIVDNHFYSNALVLSQDGKPLCTIDHKRIEWYLLRGLATEINPPDGYPRAIQLNFRLKCEYREPKNYELAIIRTECVLCGSKEKLTVHHVVPRVIRKLFPKSEKNRSRQWCLLLCISCHKKVELRIQAVYKTNYPMGIKDESKRNEFVLRRLKGMNILDRLEPEKMAKLMSEAGYTTIEQIPAPPTDEENDALHRHASMLHRKAIDKWAYEFIEEHGGIEGTKAYFRELFLSFNPQYVPDGYLDI